jgi:hypothetical protein
MGPLFRTVAALAAAALAFTASHRLAHSQGRYAPPGEFERCAWLEHWPPASLFCS